MTIATWAIEEVRSGTIRLWHGLLANIPAGYVLCDGTSGTPDLRSKFVKGAAAGLNPGATGGSATHAHDDHAALSHSGATVADHAAGVTGAHSGTSVKVGTSASNAAPSPHTHSTPALVHTVGQAGAHAALSHIAANSEPVYYAVAYIMKT